MDDPLMLQYHDREWGVPVHADRKHFEFLVLEAAQAGLSWSIVLKKREGYRRAFSEFDPDIHCRSAKEIDPYRVESSIIPLLSCRVKEHGHFVIGNLPA